MAQFDLKKHALVGPGGLLEVPAEDEITRKLSMLIEGECEGLGPLQAAQKFGFSKQRYFQLRAAFAEQGAMALAKSETRPQDQLPSDGRGGPPGDPAPLSRSRRLAGSDRPEARSERLDDQHPQRGTRAGRLRPAKKNSTSAAHAWKPKQVEARISQRVVRHVDSDPLSIERGVRQRLADKISDNMAGLWLLVPEHLRLGTWDLLAGLDAAGPGARRAATGAAVGPRSGAVYQRAPRRGVA